MKNKSIYKQFSQKIIYATTFFVVVLSFIFYGFTKSMIYEDIATQLIKDARLIIELTHSSKVKNQDLKVLTTDDTSIDIVKLSSKPLENIRKYTKNNHHYIELLHPFDINSFKYIKLTRNIDNSNKILNSIFSNLIFLSLGGMILIIMYAFAVSRTLLFPIIKITKKLSNMNENSLSKIDTKTLPVEFQPLANSINILTNKIENYVKYQKELFIGTAHELKTPLAVMKLKSQVTLRKPREQEKYEEVLNLFISEIDAMNDMVSSVLNMGRQEGAQFEKPIELDIISYLKDKIEGFKLLSKEKDIEFIFKTDIKLFITTIQKTLLTQIIQNFIQNAIKFTPNNKQIILEVKKDNSKIIIQVLDEGVGIDESLDLFAPFKRVGEKQGAGLGLFLAKSASDTLGSIISLKNRDDKKGTIATLILESKPSCKIK
ncbi:MAG: HAMP domain-containing sensor histidine kinase [Campylobacterota bacterium]|nr:HAMP domain-containing sensor histidine kinase [Campylobacterota bacterium]